MTSPPMALVQALVASSGTTTTTSPGSSSGGSSGVLGQANQVASQVDQGSGWLYHLLTKLGVDPSTASTVTDLIVRPLSILIVVIIAALVARYGAKAIRRLLTRVADKAATRSGSTRAGARVNTMSGLAANVWRLFVFVIAGAIVLGMLGINLTPLLASATIIGATLGFGAQQIVRDYFSGVLMTMEDQYNVGDSVLVGGVTGVIEDVTMRLTRFRGVDGTLYVIPNGDIRLIGNLSRGWARAVVDLTLPGTAAADMEKVRTVISEAAHEVAQRPGFASYATEPPHLVGLFAADSATITMRVMLLTVPSQRDPLTRELREAAVEALARAGLWPADPAPPAPAAPSAPTR